MPTHERKSYLSLLINENTKRREMMEEERENNIKNTGKGERTTKVSGDLLKTRMLNGEIPNQ